MNSESEVNALINKAGFKYQIVEMRDEQATREFVEERKELFKTITEERQEIIDAGLEVSEVIQDQFERVEEEVAGYEDFQGNLTLDAFEAFRDSAINTDAGTYYVLRFNGKTQEEVLAERQKQKYDRDNTRKSKHN